MKLTPQEKNLTTHVLDLYVDTLIEMTEGQPHSPKVVRCVQELETITSVLIKMVKDDEVTAAVTGVLTTAPKQPRTLDDIYSEMCSHPDFVAGSYYSKSDIIDTIICTIKDNYEDEDGIDPQIIVDAEQIYENNTRRIYNNIDGCYEYAFQDMDILDDCDLTLEKQTK